MSGTSDLETLLASLAPRLADGEFVFLTFPDASYGQRSELEPVASFIESEGLTLVVPKEQAEEAGENFEAVFRMITLQVHSSLEAVGLTAKVSEALAKQGASANMFAGFFHDHVFVPVDCADRAMAVLNELTAQHQQ